MTSLAVPAYWRDVAGPSRSGARVFRPLAYALVRGLWEVHVHRPELVPTHGPVILAANHLGLLDGPLLYALIRRPVHALIKQEMFSGTLGRLLRGLGQIPVDRSATDPAAVKACLAVLEGQGVVAIYPEGNRGRGDFGRIKPGVAYLGMCTGAPIVPVACLGTRADGRSIESVPAPRARMDVVFGRPVVLDTLPWPRRRDVVRAAASRLRDVLAAHVESATALTGRALPGPPTDPQPEPGPVVPPRPAEPDR